MTTQLSLDQLQSMQQACKCGLSATQELGMEAHAEYVPNSWLTIHTGSGQ